MDSPTNNRPLGSELWTNSDAFEDKYRARIDKFSSEFSQSALLARASHLRGGIACSLSLKFSVGSVNYVRKITFDDGIEWIARLQMPNIYDEEAVAPDTTELESEVATAEFLRLNSRIPIPRVHYYDFGDNAVGAPYILMDYVHGTAAHELSYTIPGNNHSIPAQYFEKFWKQVASIVVELSSIRVPQIGSIVKENGDFKIGKLTETNSGPYKTTKDLYDDYPAQLSKKLFNGDPDFMGLPSRFYEAMREILRNASSPEKEKTFGLCKLDLGPHSLLVDHEFNILAMIDLGTIVAYPNVLLHRLPQLTSMNVPAPWDTNNIDPRFKGGRENAKRYAEFIAEAEAERVLSCNGDVILQKDGFRSREALAFSALTWFGTGQDWVIESWKEGLLYLQQHDEQQVLGLHDSDLQEAAGGEGDVVDEEEPDAGERE